MSFHPSGPTDDFLLAWRWLVGDSARLIGWSSAGDLFYVDAEGLVTHLDTGAGERACVAGDRAMFDAVLAEPEAAADLLLLPVVRHFEQAHGSLAPGECLGFTTLPVFGGAYSAENRFRLPIGEHAAVTAEIHRQIRDLPDGAGVTLRVKA